jgi:altronate dehydratase
MLREDLEQHRELLAGVLANANVVRGVIVGLGCESNQSADVRDRAKEQGAEVDAIVFQALGSIDGTASAIVERLNAQGSDEARVPVEPEELRGAVLVNADTGEDGMDRATRLVTALAARGFAIHGPLCTDAAPSVTNAGLTVPEIWAGRPQRNPNDVEALSAAAGTGAVFAIAIGRQAAPLGSPVMPVIRVTTDASWQHTSDFVWVDADDPNAVAALLVLVEETVNGQPTLGERFGQRDFAPIRIAPTM